MGKSGGAARAPTAAERRGGGGAGARTDGRAHPNITPRGRAGGERLPQLRDALKRHEAAIVGSPREQARVLDALGNVIVAQTGSEHRVTFTAADVKKMALATFTHNHHDTLGFTLQDIRFATTYKLGEMRAVDPKYTHSMRPPLHTNWSGAYWRKVVEPSYIKHRDASLREFRQSALRMGLAPNDMEEARWHAVWERVARETGLRYSRTLAPRSYRRAKSSN